MSFQVRDTESFVGHPTRGLHCDCDFFCGLVVVFYDFFSGFCIWFYWFSISFYKCILAVLELKKNDTATRAEHSETETARGQTSLFKVLVITPGLVVWLDEHCSNFFIAVFIGVHSLPRSQVHTRLCAHRWNTYTRWILECGFVCFSLASEDTWSGPITD